MKSQWISLLIWCAPILAVAAYFDAWLCWPGRSGGWLGLPLSLRILAAVCLSLLALGICARVVEAEQQFAREKRNMHSPPTNASDYLRLGLGPVPGDAGSRELYLDLMKRVLANTIYEDEPYILYDHRHQPIVPNGFQLERRVWGEDGPTLAHTMVGVRRLSNIQFCVEDVLAADVPGDLIEMGVLRGGASIMLRAALKAHGITDRRVFVCDTFAGTSPPPRWAVMTIGMVLKGLASIPGKAWRRRLFLAFRPLKESFPKVENPSDELVELTLWFLRHPELVLRLRPPDLEVVKSNFARYGLLDEQVVFVQGFFAESIPAAPIDQVAVMRLDGDTYESTRDALQGVYPKLAKGGYCIIDDYHSFSDCGRAVEEYRQQHGITEEIVPIDRVAVYWKKTH